MMNIRFAALGASAATLLALAGCSSTDTAPAASTGTSDSGAATSSPAATGSASDLTGQTAVFTTFGGDFDKSVQQAYLDPVTASTGLGITLDSPTDYAKLQLQVDSGNVQWTQVMGDPFYAIQACGTTLEKTAGVVDFTGVDKRFIVSECSVPGDQYSYIMAYDGDVFSGANVPTSWADFFDTTKFPGKRAVWAGYVFNGMLEAALLADGVPADQLYPLDVDRALKKLDTIKSDIVFVDTLAAMQQQMESGEVVLAAPPGTNGYYSALNGANFVPVWNQQVTSWNDYVVPKGANMAVAMAISDYLVSAPAQQAIANLQPVGNNLENPVAPDAASATPEFLLWSPLVDDRLDKQIIVDQQWWADNLDAVTAKWTAFVTG